MTSSNQNGEFLQRVEDARTLAGQTVTLSFWARSTAGAQTLNCNIYQHFGTGGSPSSLVQATGGGTYTPTSSWQRYSFTFTIPSVAGKTFGTNNDSFLWVRVGQFTATTTNTSLDIWGVQLERGSVATSFRRNQPNLQAELAACQRYYQRMSSNSASTWTIFGQGNWSSSTNMRPIIQLKTTMRAVPSSVEFSNLGAGINGVSVFGVSAIAIEATQATTDTLSVNATCAASGYGTSTYGVLYAYGSTTAYLGINAEL